MVKFAARGQDHEVRSFLESLADAAVSIGGDDCLRVLGFCSREKLAVHIPAGCVLRLDGVKDQRRPVALSYHTNTGFVQVQCAANLIDRVHDKVKELNEWYVGYLAGSHDVTPIPEGSERLSSFFRKPAQCTSVNAQSSNLGAGQTERPIPSPVRPRDPNFSNAVEKLAEASLMLDNWPEYKVRYLRFLVETLGLSSATFEELTLFDDSEDLEFMSDVNKSRKHNSASSS